MRRALLISAGLTLALTVPRVARAGGPPDKPAASDEGAKREARALLREGVRLLGTGDDAGALELFRSAYAKYPSAKILLDIGSTLKTMGRAADAANTYQRYLDAPDTDPTHRAEVVKNLAVFDAALGKLQLTVDPADAEVQVGDDWLPAAQAKIVRLAPGPYIVHARKGEAPLAEAHGEIAAGATQQVALHVVAAKPKPEPPPPLPPSPPPRVAPAPVAPAVVEMRADRGEPRAGHGRLGVYTTAAGGALLIGGLVAGELAIQKRNGATGLCPGGQCATADLTARADDLMAQSRTRGDIATGLVAVGAAGVAVGAILWWTGREHEPAHVAIAPFLQPGAAGLVVTSGF